MKRSIHAENIYQLNKAYKILVKEFKPYVTCKDKDYTLGCYSCIRNRIIRDVKLLIKDLKDFYSWENKYGKPNRKIK